MAGKHAAVGDSLQFVVAEVTPVLHDPFEPGIEILDDQFDRGARLRRGRLETVRRSFERGRFDRFHLDAELGQKIADIGILEQDANRADERRLLGHDVIARKRGNAVARSGQAVDDDDERLLLLQPHQRIGKAVRIRPWCRRDCRHARSRRAPSTIWRADRAVRPVPGRRGSIPGSSRARCRRRRRQIPCDCSGARRRRRRQARSRRPQEHARR